MKTPLVQILSWSLTLFALYFAFRGVDWSALIAHLGSAHLSWIAFAIVLTSFSYLFRARRWQDLFPKKSMSFVNSAKVLILGFFMNNVLPARTGELVRAHMGAKISGDKRTLVLATIASERLADGLVISLIFILSSFGLPDDGLLRNFFYVACAFAAVGVGVVITIALREKLFRVSERVSIKLNHKASHYTHERIKLFVHGLSPLCSRSKLPFIIWWSIVIWATETCVYLAVSNAYGAGLSISECAIFLVAVNFSSLIPAAPGGLGVIEAVASAVLVAMGVEKEHALTMVITQHAIQYLIVGVPGAIVMGTWRKTLEQIKSEPNE